MTRAEQAAEQKAERSIERMKWFGMYAGLFLIIEIVGFLWFKGVIG